MRYLGSVLAMITLVALAYAGHIDNGATRQYVDAGDAAVTALIGAGDTAGSNYTKAVALGITNAFQAGDAAGSQYVAQVVATNVATDTLRLGGNLANLYPTNLSAGISDPWHSVNAITTYANSTVTLTRTHGEYVSILLTNNAAICIDRSTYPAAGATFVYCAISNGAFSVTFCTNSISTNSATAFFPGSGGISMTNTDWNVVTFYNAPYNTNRAWSARQTQ